MSVSVLGRPPPDRRAQPRQAHLRRSRRVSQARRWPVRHIVSTALIALLRPRLPNTPMAWPGRRRDVFFVGILGPERHGSSCIVRRWGFWQSLPHAHVARTLPTGPTNKWHPMRPLLSWGPPPQFRDGQGGLRPPSPLAVEVTFGPSDPSWGVLGPPLVVT